MTQSRVGQSCARGDGLECHQFSEVDVLDHGKLGENLWIVYSSF